ncbi:putative phage tail protein [Vibrio phage 236O40-1]|nr:putative phage tail protein [Vibrio phage 236O40-1]
MADPQGLTIDQLRELVAVESHLLFAIDAPSETFNVTLQSIIEYARETINVTPTGSFIMWPGEVVPKGYIELAGQSFNVGSFPVLGSIFPSGKLIDTRGLMLKHGANNRSMLSFEAESIKGHGHAAQFNGKFVPNHSHNMQHTHNSLKVTAVKTVKTGGASAPNTISLPDSGWSQAIDTGTPPGTPLSIAFYTENRQTDGGTRVNVEESGGHTPAGSVTINSTGSSKNLVDNIAVKFIVKQE